jgi:hypothetical protein
MIGDKHEIKGVWYEEKKEIQTGHCSGCDFYDIYRLKDCPYKRNARECKSILKLVKEEVMLDYKIFVGNSEEIKKMVCKKARILGYDAKVIDCNFWYLYSYDNFGYDNSIKYFKQHKNKEISFHEFLELPEPKQEKTIKIEGKDFTIERLKKMIEEAE